MSKVRLAIIGNGMVGHRFIEDLLDKSDAANFDITVFCEEPRIAYDRVHLSSYFSHHTAEELSLVREGFYEKHGIKVLVGERAITINRQEKVIHSSAGRTVFYDKLIMATGSYPWIPPIKGSDTQDCFVYRTIEDLNAIESCARRSKRGAVVGGGDSSDVERRGAGLAGYRAVGDGDVPEGAVVGAGHPCEAVVGFIDRTAVVGDVERAAAEVERRHFGAFGHGSEEPEVVALVGQRTDFPSFDGLPVAVEDAREGVGRGA